MNARPPYNASRKGGRLTDHLNSAYVAAANRLGGRKARKRIVAYVEGYDDVLFWTTLLHGIETDEAYFDVVLPSATNLTKGKKQALANDLGERLGTCMIACVDADYDYLMQGATPTSKVVCDSPYVFHTYAYALENHLCYAKALSSVCLRATLAESRELIDFEAFLAAYSRIIWPLFAWNVWAYRYGFHKKFPMSDFYHVVGLPNADFRHVDELLKKLQGRVNQKVARLHHIFPQGKKTYKPFCEELQRLGVTPETTYLFMRGHDLAEGIVTPLLESVCRELRRQREAEIRSLAEHSIQRENELSSYRNSCLLPAELLRKHTGYSASPLYRRIQNDVRQSLNLNNGSLADDGQGDGKPTILPTGKKIPLQ